MGSFRRTVGVVFGSLIAAACGGDGGGGPSLGPTANFDAPSCTNNVCTFTDASTATSGRTIQSRNWTFENGTPASSPDPTVQVTFATAGPNTASLTVTDNVGDSDDFSREVTVTLPTTLTAGFTVTCNGLDCSFTDTSVPAGSLTYDWDFGDNTPHSNSQNPSHSYVVDQPTDFTVTLIVTDAASATATASQGVRVTPPANLQCNSGGTLADCTLDMTAQATLTAEITGHDCELAGNRLRITSPIIRTIFFNGCTAPLNQTITITGPNSDGSFSAGTQIQMQFTQGVGDPDDPPVGTPAIELEGTFPSWTLKIDDGGNPGAPGEPDFTDIVVTFTATPTP